MRKADQSSLGHIEECEPLEQQIQQEWQNNMKMLEQKQVEYLETVEQQPKNTRQVSVEELDALNQQIKDLIENFEEKESRFKSFQDLPPVQSFLLTNCRT